MSIGEASARTGTTGAATLRVAPARHAVIVTRIGYLPDTLSVIAERGRTVTVTAELEPIDLADVVIVASTRTDRRIDDDPIRVEVLEREEIEEKMLMTPDDTVQVVASESGERLSIVNAADARKTHGAEAFMRWSAEPWTVTASHTYVVATEDDPASTGRRDVPLTPTHATGVVAMWEVEDRARVGAEFYHTGEQALDDNPFRERSKPYVIVGLLAEYRVGPVRLFINGENLTSTRQTRYDRLVRPSPGVGGRWTTDAWTELSGRTVNGGVRYQF